MSVLAASVSDEVAEAFWDGLVGGAYDESVSGVLTEDVDLEWEGDAVGGYGHGDDWSPTEYASGTSTFRMPYAIKYELTGTLEVDLPVSPAEVERILEREFRTDGPKKLQGVETLGEAVVEALPDGVTPARVGRPMFSITKCESRASVREVLGGFRFQVEVLVSVDTTINIEVEPPEPDFDPPEPDDYYDSRYEP